MAEPKTDLVKVPKRHFSLLPDTLPEAKEIAEMIAASEFAPKDYKNKPSSVLIAIQMGADLGLKPMQALQNIAVINGRPSIWGDAALALAMPKLEAFEETFKGTKDSDDYTAVCRVKRKGWPNETVREFSIKDAKTAKLWMKTGRDGQPTPWVHYPYRMLQMRARGFALRDCAADLLMGLVLAEEAMDYPPIDAIDGVVVSSEVVVSPLDALDDELKSSIEKGFAACEIALGLRTAKIIEYLGAVTDPSERTQAGIKLREWLKDEYSRKKTGKSRVPSDGNNKPKPPAAQEPVIPPAENESASTRVVPSGGEMSGQTPITSSDIPFAGKTVPVDDKLSF